MSVRKSKYRKERALVDASGNLLQVLENLANIALRKQVALDVIREMGGNTISDDKLLPPSKVAKRLGTSVKTLANWRSSGTSGLRHVNVGSRIFYRQVDIDAFIRANRKSSTSQR